MLPFIQAILTIADVVKELKRVQDTEKKTLDIHFLKLEREKKSAIIELKLIKKTIDSIIKDLK